VDVCGIDVSYLLNVTHISVNPLCQKRAQPGLPSARCPSRTLQGALVSTAGGFLIPEPVQATLDGCCRPEGVCGSMMDVIFFPPFSAFNGSLGCVAATAFGDVDASEAIPCTPEGERDASSDVATDATP